MKGIAHVSFQGGGLIVPAHTPYDCELLFEHAEAATERHGDVRFDLNRQEWRISLRNGYREVCASCGRWPGNLTYRFDGQTLCAWCARRALRHRPQAPTAQAEKKDATMLTNQDPDKKPPAPDGPRDSARLG